MLDVKSTYDGHAKVAVAVAVSPDGRFLATGGGDGAIIVRRTDNMFNAVKITPHAFHSRGGVLALRFTNDSRYLLSAGADGGLFRCVKKTVSRIRTMVGRCCCRHCLRSKRTFHFE